MRDRASKPCISRVRKLALEVRVALADLSNLHEHARKIFASIKYDYGQFGIPPCGISEKLIDLTLRYCGRSILRIRQ